VITFLRISPNRDRFYKSNIENNMNQDYIIPDNWSVIEEGFEEGRVEASESLFSLGNGAMGQRANFEESYSQATPSREAT
jgi:hypothetical protein